jgi:hypothetical protein
MIAGNALARRLTFTERPWGNLRLLEKQSLRIAAKCCRAMELLKRGQDDACIALAKRV